MHTIKNTEQLSRHSFVYTIKILSCSRNNEPKYTYLYTFDVEKREREEGGERRFVNPRDGMSMKRPERERKRERERERERSVSLSLSLAANFLPNVGKRNPARVRTRGAHRRSCPAGWISILFADSFRLKYL